VEFGQARLKKRGTPAGKLLSNHLLLSKHHHTDDCRTRVSHRTSGILVVLIPAYTGISDQLTAPEIPIQSASKCPPSQIDSLPPFP